MASQVPDDDYLKGFGLVDFSAETKFSWSPVCPQDHGVIHPGARFEVSVLVPIFSLPLLVGYPARLGMKFLVAPGSEGLRTMGWIVQGNEPQASGEAR